METYITMIKNNFELATEGKFKYLEKLYAAPKGTASKLRESYWIVKRQMRQEAKILKAAEAAAAKEAKAAKKEAKKAAAQTSEAIAERRAHTRLVEHARYLRRIASGEITRKKDIAPKMTRFGSASAEEFRAAKAANKAAHKEAHKASHELSLAVEKAYVKALRSTPEYKEMYNAYMRMRHTYTPEREAEYRQKKEEFDARKGDHKLLREEVKKRFAVAKIA